MSILSLTHLHTCIIISQNEPIWVGRGYERLRYRAALAPGVQALPAKTNPIF